MPAVGRTPSAAADQAIGEPLAVVHVLDSLADEAAGPSYSVPKLCEALAATGAHVALHVVGGSWQGQFAGVSLHRHPAERLPPKVAASRSLRRALGEAARDAAVIHSHGLWRMPHLYAAGVVPGTRCRLVSAPHGSLSSFALRHSRFQKEVFWRLGQRQALVAADCLHVTSDSELADVRRAGFRQPVAVIPHGFDVPAPRLMRRATPRRVLYLGRIHPIKGIGELVRAWSLVGADREGWELHIVGPGEPRQVADIRSVIAQAGAGGVFVRDAAYGADKNREYCDASVFALPSKSENFGMTVAEALGHGTPVIVGRGAPWAGIEEHRCGWWVEPTAGALAAALDAALRLSDAERDAAGQRGREWIERDFSWTDAGRRMRSVYDWLCGLGPMPACVDA